MLPPKTNSSKRIIRIDDGLISLLKKHKAEQNEQFLKNKANYYNEQFVFAREDGYPTLRKLVDIRLIRLLNKAGIGKKITLHGFRHTHTSLLIEAGVGVKEIQLRLGHSDYKTTMNIYAHMTKNMEENAAEKFSQLMRGLL
ncbi:site-specific integrase [Bacillus taeanensis]|uniref:site-specific integrase n=1 Tax=Bacillus taeanensis TaxID=273032 RepID=UPI002482BA9B|nr:site-specific integrase [Bacillus taeanensis]